mmetsp:Transcript_34544/g.95144  ORF Transcript_34544/g.95144 Transcript_34544/m.95144 type:complete len:208 (+) Transcript_34544:412-1035(+)
MPTKIMPVASNARSALCQVYLALKNPASTPLAVVMTNRKTHGCLRTSLRKHAKKIQQSNDKNTAVNANQECRVNQVRFCTAIGPAMAAVSSNWIASTAYTFRTKASRISAANNLLVSRRSWRNGCSSGPSSAAPHQLGGVGCTSGRPSKDSKRATSRSASSPSSNRSRKVPGATPAVATTEPIRLFRGFLTRSPICKVTNAWVDLVC